MIPTLTTDRLVLRAPQQSDFESYFAFCSSPRSQTVGGPFNRAETFTRFCALIGHWTIHGFGRWMVANKVTDAPLGVIGLFHPPDWPEPELAWSVFKDGEGKGVAFEAATAARNHAYDTLGWTRLISLIDPANTRSVALAKRLGCAPGGTYDHPTYGTLHYWTHPAPEKDNA